MKPQNPLATPCPGCGGPSQVRSSRSVTPIFRTVYLVCKDIECGCTFAAGLEVTHVISPSSRETPRVRLPYRPSLRTQPGAVPDRVAAEIVAGAANDVRATPPAASAGG